MMSFVYFVVAAFIAVVLAGQIGLLSGKQPADLGVVNQRLKQPSLTRNSVSSQAQLYPEHVQVKYASIEPLSLINKDAALSMQALTGILKAMPGVTIVENKPDYIYVQAQSKVLKFVDDVEFWVNPTQGVIDVRSASRLGREDFGVNRKRVDEIRSKYSAK